MTRKIRIGKYCVRSTMGARSSVVLGCLTPVYGGRFRPARRVSQAPRAGFSFPVEPKPYCTLARGPIAVIRQRKGSQYRAFGRRSEESRVGNGCVRTCTSRWSPDHEKKKRLTRQQETNTK